MAVICTSPRDLRGQKYRVVTCGPRSGPDLGPLTPTALGSVWLVSAVAEWVGFTGEQSWVMVHRAPHGEGLQPWGSVTLG